MTDPGTNPPPSRPVSGSGSPERKGARVSPKAVMALVVVVLAVIFALLNNDKRTVNVFGYQAHTFLWLFLLIMLVVGILVGLLLPFGRSRKKK